MRSVIELVQPAIYGFAAVIGAVWLWLDKRAERRAGREIAHRALALQLVPRLYAERLMAASAIRLKFL